MPFDPEKFNKVKQQLLTDSGVPPGKVEGQPTVGDQINAIKQEELKKRLAAQEDPAHQSVMPMLRSAAGGLKEGLMRQDTAPDAPLSERAGAFIGKTAPLALGMAAAPMLAPEMAAGAFGSAALTGGGAGVGEVAGLGLSKAMGGNAPSTPSGYASAGLKTGLATALADLGLSATGAVISKAPEMAAAFLRVPSEAIKRAISRMQEGVDIIPKGGPMSQLNIENKAMANLKGLQDSVFSKRKELGSAVDDALNALHEKTQGKALFDVEPLAKDARNFMNEILQTADPTVKALMGKDYSQILDVVKTMENNPMKTAKTMVKIRRGLDDMNDFNAMGVPKIASDAGKQAYKRLADNFREVIDGAGTVLNDKSLVEANAKFHDFANSYDEIRDMIGTKNQYGLTLRRKLTQLQGQFNSGGAGPDLIARIGRNHPEFTKGIDSLLDHVAGRSFTMDRTGTAWGDMLRKIVEPEDIGGMLRVGQHPLVNIPTRVAGKVIPPAIKAGAGALLQPDQGPPAMLTP